MEQPELVPLEVAAATALVKAVVTDAWPRIRTAVGRLWRRAHPEQAAEIDTELDGLHTQALRARDESSDKAERALVDLWEIKLRQLLRADPAMDTAVREVLDQVMIPALDPGEAATIPVAFAATASDHAHLQQQYAGGDISNIGRDQYHAEGDLTIGRP